MALQGNSIKGRLTGAGIPIVCMPHRLVIDIEGGETDAWS